MPITSEPKPLPTPLNYVPPGSVPYRVSASDSFYSLADRPDVKSFGLSPNDLCYFNFGTRKPPEINWYLYHKVGCRSVTHDGYNYKFSSSDQPGVVYLPAKPAVIPPPQPEVRLNSWFGLGAKAGTQFVVVGIETIVGWVFSLDDVGKGMTITCSANRLGPGFGAGLGLCFIYVSGVATPQKLNGWQQMDWDFNLSLGENWGKLGQAANKVRKFKPLIDGISKIGARTPKALKAALKAEPDRWVDLIKNARSMKDSLGIDPNGDPNVFMFDVPFISGGAEVSLFYGLQNFNAVYDNL